MSMTNKADQMEAALRGTDRAKRITDQKESKTDIIQLSPLELPLGP